jgi:hypothetical protein
MKSKPWRGWIQGFNDGIISYAEVKERTKNNIIIVIIKPKQHSNSSKKRRRAANRLQL